VPKNCPECGNQDIGTLGSGTQKLEDALSELYPSAKILRVDTDATRKKGSAEKLFETIHEGLADIIVGTQMLAKGHDFESVDTVVVLDADKSLYSHDFRSTERLFSQLIQVAGRGGRSEKAINPRIFIQTELPDHELYQAVLKKDVNSYLTTLTEDRKVAGLPPYSSQALVIADGRNGKEVIQLLNELRTELLALPDWPIYDAVPRAMAKVAGKERGQILIETNSRPLLQVALNLANELLEVKRKKSRSIRFIIERDPSTY
jgi:primosomal protein N' (replication factor Y)